ncbi:MAG: hypothetical protein ABI836_11390 [Gemmatimonadota bacterium]
MRVSRWFGLVSVLVLAASTQAGAQGKKITTNRDTTLAVTMAPNMSSVMDSIGPIFSTMMGSMYAGIIEYMARPETAAKLAAFTKNYFDELMKKGFTREEALMLVRGMGMPGIPGMQH